MANRRPPQGQGAYVGPSVPLVAFLDHSGLPGGGQLGLARFLAATQLPHARVVQLDDGTTFDHLPDSGIKVDKIEKRRGVSGLLASRSSLKRWIRAASPAVLVANSNRSALVLASLPKQVGETRVYYMRDDLNPGRKSLVKRVLIGHWMMRRYDAVIANSQWTRSTIPNKSIRESAEVAYPVSGLSARSSIPTHLASDAPVRILSLSRIARWKGIDVLLDAVDLLQSRGLAERLAVTIAGASTHEDASYETEIRRRVEQTQPNVQVIGHVDDVDSLLADHDVLVACSTTPEPFGQVVVQGMATGLVTICSNAGGPTEIIKNLHDGLLVAPNDASAIADSIEWIIRNPSDAELIGSRAASSALRYEDSKTVADLEKIIRDKVAARGLPQRHEGRISVLQAIPDPAKRGHLNPYNALLAENLPQNITTRYLQWPLTLLERIDVVHLHWPEQLIRHSTKIGRLAKRSLAVLLLLRIYIAGIPVIETLHNVRPHEPGDHFESWFLRALRSRTSLVVRMNDFTPTPDGVASRLILHGHYRLWYPASDKAVIPGRILLFGMLRGYKGVDSLLSASREIDGLSQVSSIRIVGRPESKELAARVAAAASEQSALSYRLEFLPEQELSDEIASAEAIILPYEDLHNSGAALLALSLGRPIIARDNQPTRALRDEFGHEWVSLVSGPITIASLESALIDLRSRHRPSLPPLAQREWDVLGAKLAEAYEALARRTRPAP